MTMLPGWGKNVQCHGPVIPVRPGLVHSVMAMSDSSTQRSLGLAVGSRFWLLMAPAAVAILPQLLPAEKEVKGGIAGQVGLSLVVADQALAMGAIWQVCTNCLLLRG